MSKLPKTRKEKKFNKALTAAADALDSIGVPFHLHSGTALGAHREKTFIAHDEDLDIAIFIEDYTPKVLKVLRENGFTLERAFGKMDHGREYTFSYKNGVLFDIFLIYKGVYKKKSVRWYASYLNEICDNMKYKKCRWFNSPYRPVRMDFLGREYFVIPKKTIIEIYGKTWNVPKKYTYDEGVEKREWPNLIEEPKRKSPSKRRSKSSSKATRKRNPKKSK